MGTCDEGDAGGTVLTLHVGYCLRDGDGFVLGEVGDVIRTGRSRRGWFEDLRWGEERILEMCLTLL